MRYTSSGHSHGSEITVIFEGVPSNLAIDVAFINHELKRRQQGYGRGGRMKIENDHVHIVGGVLFGKTTGAPLTLIIQNNDYVNHQDVMDPFNFNLDSYQPITVPRPGHADLVGAMKYQVRDMKVILERASARETVSRVVVGAICKQILNQLDIRVTSYVSQIASVVVKKDEMDKTVVEQSDVRMPCLRRTEEAKALIDHVKENKDTLGGIVHVEVTNVPIGLGSYAYANEKLDACIAKDILSIQSCKGVSFGDGFSLADQLGSQVHDEISYDHGFKRTSNHYGGFEGGMTNGMPIVVNAVFKPIPTLMSPLMSVDINTKEIKKSHIERSDVCVIPSASIISEHTVAFQIVKSLCRQFSSDTMERLMRSVSDYRKEMETY